VWSHDGRWLACTEEGQVVIADGRTLEETRILELPNSAITHLAFGKRTLLVESQNRGRRITVFDVADWQFQGEVPSAGGPSPDRRYIAAVSFSPDNDDEKPCSLHVQMFRVAPFGLAWDRTFPAPPDAPRDLGSCDNAPAPNHVWSPSGRLVVVARRDDRVFVLDSETGHTITVLPQGWRLGGGFAFSDKDRYLAAQVAGNYGRVAGVLDLTSGRRVLLSDPDLITEVAPLFSADGRRIATPGWGFAVLVWDTSTGRLLYSAPSPRPQKRPIEDEGMRSPVMFSADGRTLFTESPVSNYVRRCDAQTGRPLPFEGWYRFVTRRSNDSALVFVGADGSSGLRVCAGYGRHCDDLPGTESLRESGFASSDGEFIASGRERTSLGRSRPAFAPIELGEDAQPRAFSPDGSLVVDHDCLQAWRTRNGSTVVNRRTKADKVSSLGFDPDRNGIITREEALELQSGSSTSPQRQSSPAPPSAASYCRSGQDNYRVELDDYSDRLRLVGCESVLAETELEADQVYALLPYGRPKIFDIRSDESEVLLGISPKVYFWSPRGGAPIAIGPLGESVAFGPRGRAIFVTWDTLTAVSTENGQVVWRTELPLAQDRSAWLETQGGDPRSRLRLTGDLRTIAFDNGSVHLLDAMSGRVEHSLSTHLSETAFDDEGRLLAAAEGSIVSIWTSAPWRLQMRIARFGKSRVAFDARGRFDIQGDRALALSGLRCVEGAEIVSFDHCRDLEKAESRCDRETGEQQGR
jgi:WD40 repeat protein